MRRRSAVTFAESAIRDLLDVREWFDSHAAPAFGERLVGEVVERVEQLALFPESGRVVPEFGTPWLRELVHPPFRIVYRFDGRRVRVVRVWRTERLLEQP